MPTRTLHVCPCPICQLETDHPDKALHQRLNLLVSRLDEQQRRWFVAHESQRIGHGGDTRLAEITGLDQRTIAKGRQELQEGLASCPTQRLRPQGAGRPLAEKKRCVRAEFAFGGRSRNRRRPHDRKEMGTQ